LLLDAEAEDVAGEAGAEPQLLHDAAVCRPLQVRPGGPFGEGVGLFDAAAPKLDLGASRDVARRRAVVVPDVSGPANADVVVRKRLDATVHVDGPAVLLDECHIRRGGARDQRARQHGG
jgi:hypothetical protein